jgi:hypothetical protein
MRRRLRKIIHCFAPNDSYVIGSIANIEWEKYVRLSRGLDDPTSLDSNLDHVIEYSQKAIEINRLDRGAYQWLWLAQLQRNEKLDALKAMMANYQMDPSDIYLSFTIGRYLASLDKPTLSRPFLDRVKNFSHHNQERQTARAILDAIPAGKVND